jgi:hypothetical protein
MLDIVFLIMLFVFLIMFVSNLYLDNPIFGMISGMWLIVIAGAILIDGIKLQSGTTITTLNGTTYMNNTYTDLVLPFPSSASVIFGLFFVCLSIYIIYKNGMEL